ncbi:AsmA family protein [Ferrimonas balearica]|uniref:AsmA family protein n=1 Tax=Ferrimonas balearica TaxID=44012 RepID=UPI001C99BACE|nr:AsmA family protein [Ferrimonas balearica]MBY5920818.1 AsmA family protein [Ferrimonas balearica]MBY5996497.1 AsmA family protein [Ferrimonas balearica]
MMKVIKGLLLALLAVVVVVGGYLAFFFDLNSFKGPIADKVKQVTGRDLVIDGDIGWSLYPTLGLDLAKIQLGNLPGENLPPLLSVDQASVGVALLPLLSRELQVEELAVSGVRLELVTLPDGRSSLTGLGGDKPAETQPDEGSKPQTAPSGPKHWVLGHLAVNDLTIHNDNRAAGADQTVAIKQLELARIEPERAAPLRLEIEVGDGDLAVATQAEAMLTVSADFSRFQIDDWRQQLTAQGSAVGKQPLKLGLAWDADLDLARQHFKVANLELKLADFVMTGEAQADLAGVRPSFVLKAKGNHLNLDPWLPPAESADESKPDTAPTPKDGPQEEPDLSAMKLMDLDADLHLGALQARGVLAENLALKVRLKEGVLTLEKASGKAFGGQLTANASLDGTVTPARYRFDNRIEHLAIQPMLQALADVDLLAGTGAFHLKGQGEGLTGKAMNQLTASGGLSLQDGAVYGVNVAQMIREAEAKLKGDLQTQVVEQKTDFSTFSTELKIKDGTLATPNLEIASPLLRISGDGKVAIEPQTLDYALTVSLVGSLEGQGGKGVDELKDIPIPLTVSGPVTDLQFGLDTDALLKGKLDQEKEKLEEKLKDKLMEKLGNF